MVVLGQELRAPNSNSDSNSDSSPKLSFSLSSQLRVGKQPLTPTLPNTHSEPYMGWGGDNEESGSVLRTLQSRGKDFSSTLKCDEIGLSQGEQALRRAFQAKETVEARVQRHKEHCVAGARGGWSGGWEVTWRLAGTRLSPHLCGHVSHQQLPSEQLTGAGT